MIIKNRNIIFILTFIFLATSCGKPDVTGTNTASLDEPTISIKWGWGHELEIPPYATIPAGGSVIHYMEDKFNVEITKVLYDYERAASVETPDIFPNYNLSASDDIRFIPRAMIEEYAPRYAALLSREPYGWEINKVPGEEAYTGLLMYYDSNRYLNDYSVYRLDWLEALDIRPNGPVTEIYEDIYFTDKAFTQNQFLSIMDIFTRASLTGVDTHGFAMLKNPEYLYYTAAPLLGMFGLNSTSSWMFAAEDDYKEFLRFLAQAYNNGILTLAGDDYSLYADEINNGRIGWWMQNIWSVSLLRMNYFAPLFENEPNVKLLVTPPEIGVSGKQGAGALSVLPFTNYVNWGVNANVSDEKLARLLTMYDELSFDRETWLVSRYGFEGETYHWEGEPYTSRVIQTNEEWNTSVNEGAYAMFTFIFDGEAGRNEYITGSNAMTEFARSEAGKRLVIFPQKEDILNNFSNQRAAFNEQRRNSMLETIGAFFVNVVTGQLDIDNHWDIYLTELDTSGFAEYRVMYESYPTVEK
jgi:hypothetical protein